MTASSSLSIAASAHLPTPPLAPPCPRPQDFGWQSVSFYGGNPHPFGAPKTALFDNPSYQFGAMLEFDNTARSTNDRMCGTRGVA